MITETIRLFILLFISRAEFTTLEMYGAYMDYQDMMTLTEEMLAEIVKIVSRGRNGEAICCLGRRYREESVLRERKWFWL